MKKSQVVFWMSIFIVAALVPSCTPERNSPNEESVIKEAIKVVKDKYCVDSRLSVMDLQWEHHAGQLVLKGEVDNASAKEELLLSLEAKFPKRMIDSILVLPDPKLGERTLGIVTNSVGNVRSKPGEAQELANQLLMGMAVKVLKQRSGYSYIQSSDRYLGWLDNFAIRFVTQSEANAWMSASKVIVTAINGTVRESPSPDALPVSDAVAACLMKRIGEKGTWCAIELPDGRKGYIERRLVQDYDSWKKTRALNGTTIAKTAKSLLGIPYLWGGTSTKGMDCSGFTKTVFRLNGMELNRDADQQATMGEPVASNDNFRLLRSGDLLFFGQKGVDGNKERITHVGIYLANLQYIHSSGRVRLSSFDPTSPIFEDRLLKRFVRARRVIPQTQVPEVAKSK
jgi:SH3-like domain-containing protein